MPVLRWALQLHKWIALIIGVQVLLWVTGGVVMSVIPIERVRGEHHTPPVVGRALPLGDVLPLGEAAKRAAVTPSKAELRPSPRGPVWVLTLTKGDPVAVDARSGVRLGAFDALAAKRYAQQSYVGSGKPVRAELLPKAPQETGKEGPLWRVDFDDEERTALYLSPQTGEAVSRRSDLWRFYDFFWRLHIMDWTKGENFNHPLIIAAALLALGTVIAGFVLLWLRLERDFKKWRAASAAKAATS